MSTAPELKPCPFCGESDELYPGFRHLADKPYQIDCIGCGTEFTPREGMDAIAAWNRRAIYSSPAGAPVAVPQGEAVAKLTVFEAFGGRRKISVDASMTEALPIGEYNLFLATASPASHGVVTDASMPAHAKWCQPGDKQNDRHYLVRFDDPDCNDAVFTDWDKARTFYAKATLSWNCWLFAAVPADAIASPVPQGEAVAQNESDQAGSYQTVEEYNAIVKAPASETTVAAMRDERDAWRRLASCSCGCQFEDDGETQTLQCGYHEAERNAARAEVERLTKALEPFAEASRRFDAAGRGFNVDPRPDSYVPRTDFTHGELRAAARALDRSPSVEPGNG